MHDNIRQSKVNTAVGTNIVQNTGKSVGDFIASAKIKSHNVLINKWTVNMVVGANVGPVLAKRFQSILGKLGKQVTRDDDGVFGGKGESHCCSSRENQAGSQIWSPEQLLNILDSREFTSQIHENFAKTVALLPQQFFLQVIEMKII